jgi:GT2 family glycosyltransferase
LARPGSFVQGQRVYAGTRASQRLLDDWRCGPTFWTRDLRRRARLLRVPLLAWWFRQRPHRRARFIQGCNQGYWRDDLVRVNGFDERFASWGREDDELAARLFHAGLTRIDLRFAAVAVHLHHPRREPAGPNPNDRYLAETRAAGSTRCALGLDQHL